MDNTQIDRASSEEPRIFTDSLILFVFTHSQRWSEAVTGCSFPLYGGTKEVGPIYPTPGFSASLLYDGVPELGMGTTEGAEENYRFLPWVCRIGFQWRGKIICIFFFFLLFRATPAAHGSSQARGQIGAIAAGLHPSHSNIGSLTH